ncbi:NAD-dependent epimerase/dehydratase [candidate division TM7 genomosp. GTL1]|nr:NAD-dependent epimerase/dehydratase [candidate division TM7 genomosp. GTL1]
MRYTACMEKRGKILVTGANGFVGPYLARELKKRDVDVVGLGYGDSTPELRETVAEYIACDLTDETSVKEKIDFSEITAVIHLAGLSSQGQSFGKPHHTISANAAMAINLFERALEQEKKPRFVVVSTGALYDSNQPMPLTEESKIAFNSPYAISKHVLENLCDYYRTRGFETVVVRPFNHTGPGQGPGFLIPDLARQVLEVGKGGTLKVGNLGTRRDYSDAWDIVKAYAILATAENLPHTLYNLCSSKSRSGEEILELIAKAVFGSEDAVSTEIDQSRIRPNDPPEIFGNATRMKEDFDWQPTIPLEQTITDYISWLSTRTL